MSVAFGVLSVRSADRYGGISEDRRAMDFHHGRWRKSDKLSGVLGMRRVKYRRGFTRLAVWELGQLGMPGESRGTGQFLQGPALPAGPMGAPTGANEANEGQYGSGKCCGLPYWLPDAGANHFAQWWLPAARLSMAMQVGLSMFKPSRGKSVYRAS